MKMIVATTTANILATNTAPALTSFMILIWASCWVVILSHTPSMAVLSISLTHTRQMAKAIHNHSIAARLQ